MKNDIQMPNNFIFSPQAYETYEKRLLYLSLHQIRNRQDSDLQLRLFDDQSIQSYNPADPFNDREHSRPERTVMLSYSEIKDKGNWKLFLNSLDKFRKREISYKYVDKVNPENSFESEINIIEECRRYKGKGIMIVFSPSGFKILTHLSRSYSKIPLEYALKLISKYSQRLYELLLSRCFGGVNGNWSIEIDEFKKLLGIPSDKYRHWGSLEKTALKVPQEEFKRLIDPEGNKLIPIRFTYTTTKTGKKTTRINFDVFTIAKSVQKRIDTELSERQKTALEILIELNVAEKYRMKIITMHLNAFFKWNYSRQMAKTKIVNPAGHLLTSLGLVGK